MKPEKEVAWGAKLLLSNFVRGIIFTKTRSGCKKDFERECEASENSKEFRIWLEMLIDRGILEFEERRNVGSFSNEVDTYVINKSKLEKLLSRNEVWNNIWKIFDRGRVI